MTSFINTVKMTGRPAVASCLPGSSVIPATAERGTGLLAVINERPTQASVAAAAQAYGYASWANGAGLLEANGTFGGSTAFVGGCAADGSTTVVTQHHRKMRAFRGLKPWRDPA